MPGRREQPALHTFFVADEDVFWFLRQRAYVVADSDAQHAWWLAGVLAPHAVRIEELSGGPGVADRVARVRASWAQLRPEQPVDATSLKAVAALISGTAKDVFTSQLMTLGQLLGARLVLETEHPQVVEAVARAERTAASLQGLRAALASVAELSEALEAELAPDQLARRVRSAVGKPERPNRPQH